MKRIQSDLPGQSLPKKVLYSLDEKKRLVRDYRESGMSIAAFSRKHSINHHTFRNWIKKDQGRTEIEENIRPEFVEVELTGGRTIYPMKIHFYDQIVIEVYTPLDLIGVMHFDLNPVFESYSHWIRSLVAFEFNLHKLR